MSLGGRRDWCYPAAAAGRKMPRGEGLLGDMIVHRSRGRALGRVKGARKGVGRGMGMVMREDRLAHGGEVAH